jgi:hypothetical protein
MYAQPQYIRPSRHNRRAVATLEFVMALPLLFVLMICILWEGFWLIGQAEVLVTARNDAWKKRFDDLADNPLSFPILPEHDLPVLPKYNKTADYANEKASTTVDVTPAFNRIPGPEASHTILAGSWDFNALPLDTPPNIIPMGKAAVIGAFGSILDVASSATDPLGLIKKFASAKSEGQQINSDTERRKSDVGKGGSADGAGGDGGGGNVEGGKTPEEAQKDAEEDLRQQKIALKKRFKELGATFEFPSNRIFPVGGEWGKAQDELIAAQADARVKADLALQATEEEDKKKKQEEAARARRKVELLQVTVKRLETEANDIVREAEALDMSLFELTAP